MDWVIKTCTSEIKIGRKGGRNEKKEDVRVHDLSLDVWEFLIDDIYQSFNSWPCLS